jgi:hypothetical protein
LNRSKRLFVSLCTSAAVASKKTRFEGSENPMDLTMSPDNVPGLGAGLQYPINPPCPPAVPPALEQALNIQSVPLIKATVSSNKEIDQAWYTQSQGIEDELEATISKANENAKKAQAAVAAAARASQVAEALVGSDAIAHTVVYTCKLQQAPLTPMQRPSTRCTLAFVHAFANMFASISFSPTQCRHSHSHSHSHFPAELPISREWRARGHRESLPPSSERASRIDARRGVLQRPARVKTPFWPNTKKMSELVKYAIATECKASSRILSDRCREVLVDCVTSQQSGFQASHPSSNPASRGGRKKIQMPRSPT